MVRCYVTFMSEDFNVPFQRGAVVKCVSDIAIDVSSYRKIWYGNE